MTTPQKIPAASVKPQPPFYGAIIDAQGREIPITEPMIQNACKRLDATCAKVQTRR